MTDLLTIPEAAAALRCSRSRVFVLLAEGVLQRGTRYGRRAVILAESVAAALSAQPEPVPVKRQRRVKRSTASEIDAVLARARGK